MEHVPRNRVIAHVDLDSFYTQVEAKRNPSLKGQPVAVIQYNPNDHNALKTALRPGDPRIFPSSNGSIIAVSYEARAQGVKRNMMGQEAKKLCPSLVLVQVPTLHGKADLTIYREAGAQVAAILSRGTVCERASIDEAYMDVTEEAMRRLAALAPPPTPAQLQPAGAGGGGGGGSSLAAPAVPEPLSFEGIHLAGLDQEEAEQAALALLAEEGPQDADADSDANDGTDGGADPGLPDQAPQQAAAAAAAAAASSTAAAALPPPAAAAGRSAAAALARWWRRPPAEWDCYERLLAAGAAVVSELRGAVLHELGFTCSAGVAHYKLMAKLGSGLHKPNQQTVVLARGVAPLLRDLPIPKLRSLGGKWGEAVQRALGVGTVGQLAATPLARVAAALGVDDGVAAGLLRLAGGMDDEEVKPRMANKSLSCGKTFRGRNALTAWDQVHHWLVELGREMEERVEADRQQHARLPGLLTVHVQAELAGQEAASVSRSGPLRRPSAEALAADALTLLKKWAPGARPRFRITSMFLGASNFASAPTGASTITRFLSKPATSGTASGAASGQQQRLQQRGGSSAASKVTEGIGRFLQASAGARDMVNAAGAGTTLSTGSPMALSGRTRPAAQQPSHVLEAPSAGDHGRYDGGGSAHDGGDNSHDGDRDDGVIWLASSSDEEEADGHGHARTASPSCSVRATTGSRAQQLPARATTAATGSGCAVASTCPLAGGTFALPPSHPDADAAAAAAAAGGGSISSGVQPGLPAARAVALLPGHGHSQQGTAAAMRGSQAAEASGHHHTDSQAVVCSLGDWLASGSHTLLAPAAGCPNGQLQGGGDGDHNAPVPEPILTLLPPPPQEQLQQCLQLQPQLPGRPAVAHGLAAGIDRGLHQQREQQQQQHAADAAGHDGQGGADGDGGGSGRSAVAPGVRRPATAAVQLQWADVDPEVLHELPLHIQQELKRGLMGGGASGASTTQQPAPGTAGRAAKKACMGAPAVSTAAAAASAERKTGIKAYFQRQQ